MANETNDKRKMLDFAVQQFTGYAAAVKGGGNPLMELVEAMGLTSDEYRAIRKELQWMPRHNLEELDQHFGVKRRAAR